MRIGKSDAALALALGGVVGGSVKMHVSPLIEEPEGSGEAIRKGAEMCPVPDVTSYLPPIGYDGDAVFRLFEGSLNLNHVELSLLGYGVLGAIYLGGDEGVKRRTGSLANRIKDGAGKLYGFCPRR